MLFNRKQSGFTLIELLIVIVIIGILAAIAVPKFAQNKQAAETSACRANLSMLDSAQERYQFDNAGYGTMAQLTAGSYVKTEPHCPSNSTTGAGAYTFTSGSAACPNVGTAPYTTHHL